jgi:hypothetical protein
MSRYPLARKHNSKALAPNTLMWFSFVKIGPIECNSSCEIPEILTPAMISSSFILSDFRTLILFPFKNAPLPFEA